MPYRKISPPSNASALTTTEDWLAWADREHLVPSVAPVLDGTCEFCYGAVGELSEGGYFSQCVNCGLYRGHLAGVVPIVYSIDAGFESLLHRYKDFGEQHRWLAIPLGSVLSEFLSEHRDCINEAFGNVDRFAAVPSTDSTRGFDPLREALSAVSEWPVEWDLDLVEHVREGRPERGEVDPSFYELAKGADVRNEVIVVVDDTWTSGSSLASVGAMLRGRGAKRVIGLPIGRQVKRGFGSSDDLVDEAIRRTYSADVCVLCG